MPTWADIVESPPLTPESPPSEDTDDHKPPAIASRSTDDKFDDIMKILMSLQADFRQSHNRIDDLDGHLGTIDSNLEVIDNSVTHLKLDVHAIENIQDRATRIDDIDAKVSDLETDLEGIKVDVANIEVFTEATTPMINQATCPSPSPSASPPVSGDARGEFPRFSSYMGTTIPLQKTVPPDKYSKKILLPSRSSTTGSYVDAHPILLIGSSADASHGLPPDPGLLPLLNSPMASTFKSHIWNHSLDLLLSLRFDSNNFIFIYCVSS